MPPARRHTLRPRLLCLVLLAASLSACDAVSEVAGGDSAEDSVARGCTDPMALNFDSAAVESDASCEFTTILFFREQDLHEAWQGYDLFIDGEYWHSIGRLPAYDRILSDGTGGPNPDDYFDCTVQPNTRAYRFPDGQERELRISASASGDTRYMIAPHPEIPCWKVDVN